MSDSPSADLGPGAIRTAVVWDAVRDVLAAMSGGDGLTIIDVGGGTGGLAVRIARLGHRVTVIDPNPNALASLHRRAVDGGVETLVRAVQGDATDLGGHAHAGTVDFVLCHGVLDVLEDPAESLECIQTALRPGGVISLLVHGRPAGVLARALAGQFERALELLDADVGAWDLDEHGPRRFTRSEVDDLLAAHDFRIDRIDAVRVFADLIPSALMDTESGARRALLQLERSVAARGEFLALASQLHALASRPG